MKLLEIIYLTFVWQSKIRCSSNKIFYEHIANTVIFNVFLQISPILSICLAALYPLTLLEIYYSINALCATEFIAWDEFLQRFKVLFHSLR